MEHRDVYTKNGVKTGRQVASSRDLACDEYLLHTHVIYRNADGLYLLQQRALKAKYFPGKWDVTGGGVSAGEDSLTAGIRETREELGIELDPNSMRYVGREIRTEYGSLITDMWAVNIDIALDDITIDRHEVESARFVTFDEFVNTVCYNKTDYCRELLLNARDLLEK